MFAVPVKIASIIDFRNFERRKATDCELTTNVNDIRVLRFVRAKNRNFHAS